MCVAEVLTDSSYSGYLDSFEYTGPWVSGGGAMGSDVQNILTIDACTHSHFSESQVIRDVQKAVLAFSCCEPGQVISTGRWGCGVFGGTPAHKFAQQLVAAAMSGAALQFSTFGTPDGCDEILTGVLGVQEQAGAEAVSAGRLLAAILACEGCRRGRGGGGGDFVQRFLAALGGA